MRKYIRVLPLLLLTTLRSALAAPPATAPARAEPLEWRGRHFNARHVVEAGSIEMVPARTNARALSISIFPTRIETATGTLPTPDTAARAERVLNGTGELWKFTASATGGTAGAVYFYTTEVEFNPAQDWIRRRCRVRTDASGESPLLTRVVLDETDVSGLEARQPFAGWQGYPILSHDYFWGVEFPVSAAVVKGNLGQLAYQPGVHLRTGIPYETWPVVYGIAPPGRAREAFERYIETLRPSSAPVHIQYNSWWSLPFPYTEQMIVDLIHTFDEKLHRANRARLDTFCIDLGWSSAQSIWEIDRKNFPQGFAPLARALKAMDSRLGLWVSPSSVYEQAQDLAWARAQGYETITQPGNRLAACMGGARYCEALKTSLSLMTREVGIAHFKFDGYVPECPEKAHGHEPGELSREQLALGAITVFRALRAANPNVWIEATCFGQRPSPWWLAHINTVIGTFGDDAPAGRTPCPIYRESYTTARDFFNLQGARDVLIPISTQEVLGVVHQSPESFQNDAVVVALRGHAFIPLYVNPRYMDDRRWRFLARWSEWVRAQAPLLSHTRAIYTGMWKDEAVSRDWNGPVGRDPYGYAHFEGGRGLILLRNPWIEPQEVALPLDGAIGCPDSLLKVRARNLYPLLARMTGEFSSGDVLHVSLAPYETRLIELERGSDAPPLPAPPTIAVESLAVDRESESALQARFEIMGDAPGRELLILSEGASPLAVPEISARINGQDVTLGQADSAAGWRASGLPDPRAWSWRSVKLPPGRMRIELRAAALEKIDLSAWVVAREELADDPEGDAPLPPPEFRYTTSVCAIPPTRLQFNRPPDEVNLARLSAGARASASSVYGAEFPADRAIDDAPETRWNSNGGDVNGAWLAVSFPTECEVRELRFNEAAGGRITAYALQRREGETWVDILAREKPTGQLEVRHRFEGVRAREVRLLVRAATNLPSLFDVQVFGSPIPVATSPATSAP